MLLDFGLARVPNGRVRDPVLRDPYGRAAGESREGGESIKL